MFSQEERDELVKQIDEAKQREEAALNSPVEENKEGQISETNTETIAESEKEQLKKEEEKPKEEEAVVKEDEKLDDAGYARMRREAAAAKKQAAELERQLQELKAKEKEQPEQKEDIAPEINQLLEESRYRRAAREFEALEAKFKINTPDYTGVATEYATALARSLKIQNPRLPDGEIFELTKRSILEKAGNYMRQGFDPIEELYHEARDLGFTGKSLEKQAEEPKKEERPRPDMNKVAAHRARNSGMAATSAPSNPVLTREAAANLSIAEWAKLSSEEKQRLLYPA